LGDQATLRQYPPAQLTQLVQTYIQQSLDEINASYLYPRSPMLLHLEKQRLQQLIMQWLHLEKERVPFCVVATEQRCAIQLGELSLHVVLDRMDKVEGEHVIIDYKTNDNSIYAWFDERPDEPQLPLYCISSTTPIAGLLFAQLRSEKLEFKGIVTDPSWIPNSVAASTFSNATPAWHALQQDWQRVLHHLATDFSQGNARVDPKRQQHTCQYCTLSTLCRIRELTLGNDYATA
jgi:ATP-dependent helicase/nuclease subunit B